ncbi:TetR family transcriptional regulator [Saccharomonospora azurea SZMC 14600]|uniref:TetR/AcrR family transcriptional regulator n=1 Tax=Saccharomonospora azurea TaxID=40988 RepID=UPI0002400D67|nr:TetR/AcrR family transcriptional regulator [Saccharomonospora azurea]EHK88592.1 TetR family transcriptional regulator [Saccharomonospora azurea SZMC 14600]
MTDLVRRTPHQQRSRHTVTVLVEAAAQVFDAEGLAATTNRIADRAGYSVGTLYQYFPDKWALLHAVALRHLDDVERRLRATFAELDATEPDWEGTVRRLAEAVIAEHADRPRLHALLVDYAPRTREAVNALHALFDTVIAELSRHAVRCGVVDGSGDGEAERAVALWVHAADAQWHRVLLGHTDDPDVLTRTLLALR